MGMFPTGYRTGVYDQSTCSCIGLKIADFKQCSGGVLLSSQLCLYTCHNVIVKVWGDLTCQRSYQTSKSAKFMSHTVQMVIYGEN